MGIIFKLIIMLLAVQGGCDPMEHNTLAKKFSDDLDSCLNSSVGKHSTQDLIHCTQICRHDDEESNTHHSDCEDIECLKRTSSRCFPECNEEIRDNHFKSCLRSVIWDWNKKGTLSESDRITASLW